MNSLARLACRCTHLHGNSPDVVDASPHPRRRRNFSARGIPHLAAGCQTTQRRLAQPSLSGLVRRLELSPRLADSVRSGPAARGPGLTHLRLTAAIAALYVLAVPHLLLRSLRNLGGVDGDVVLDHILNMWRPEP